VAFGSNPAFLAVTAHSAGVNWPQALAVWIPIVLALAAATVTSIRSVMKWNKARTTRVESLVHGLINSFAATMNVRFEELEEHLKRQDSENAKRFNRVDRNTGTDSTLWQILRRLSWQTRKI
jgi:hypothetical protein